MLRILLYFASEVSHKNERYRIILPEEPLIRTVYLLAHSTRLEINL